MIQITTNGKTVLAGNILAQMDFTLLQTLH